VIILSSFATSFGRALDLLKLQGRVIGALVIRETRETFGSSILGYLWAIITPVAGTLVLVYIFSLAQRQAPFGNSLMLFFGTGFITLEFFKKLSKGLMLTYAANKPLLAYPLIQEMDMLFARVLLIAATYLLIFILFFGSLVAFGFAELPAHIEVLIEAFVVATLFGMSFGMLNDLLVPFFDSWKHIEKILMRPLFFISGIFYVPSMLPPEAIAILKWNPVLHLIEWVRMGYYPNYDSLVWDPSYVLSLTLAFLLIGLGGERLTRYRRL